MKKKIFIVGGRSALAKEAIRLLSKDHDVVTGGRTDCDVYCDVTKEVNIPQNTQVVINFAASFGGNHDSEILDAIHTNIEGLLNVCVAAKEANVKHLINISSIFTFLDETSPYYSSYSVTKRQADELAKLYCKLHYLPLTILKPSQLYGDNDDFAKLQPFFYSIIDKAQSGEDISIFGKHNPMRNYIHVLDVANVIQLMVKKDVKGIYSCTYPSNTSYLEIAQTAQKVFGKGGKVVFQLNKPDILDNIFTNDDEVYKKLGYYPEISLKEGLERIKKYREINK